MSHTRLARRLAFAAGLAATAALHAQPANDDCASAIPMNDGDTVTGNTSTATNDGTATCANSGSTVDVWYSFTPAEDGFAQLSMCGSSYDTAIALFDGCAGTQIACNDDSCDLQSETSAIVSTGQTYLVRVSGFNGNSGAYTLSLTIGDAPDLSTGADVVYTDCNSVRNWGTVGGVRGYSLQSDTCNIGSGILDWGGDKPLLAMNAYRLHEGRLVQLGLSMVKNGTGAADQSGCGLPCIAEGGADLGPGCLDVYGASFNGGWGVLGPRSQVDAFMGFYPGSNGGSGNAIHKRLQVAEADLMQEGDGALYFIEGQYVAPDDAASDNAMNNASYKQVTVDESDFDLNVTGSMYQYVPAITAWRDHGNGIGTADLSVDLQTVDIPGEGRFHVATKVTDLGNDDYRYDYAIFNLNSDRSGGSFSVPIPAGVTISNVGFHDVDYHSGEPYDNTDWGSTVSANAVTWSSPQTHAQNANSNALRFSTMYNFWFDANAAPADANATLGLFKPGTPADMGVVVPAPAAGTACICEFGGATSEVTVEDLLAYLALWFNNDPGADLNGSGTDVTDLLLFLSCWFPASAGNDCP